MIRGAWFCLAVISAALVALGNPRPARAEGILVFAAASLKNALDAAAADFQQQGGAKVTLSYAASSALAKQIENGAPADVFISADLDWMDYLAQRHLIKPETRSNLLGNTLVLVAPSGSAVEIDIEPGFPLASLLGEGRLAMADPDVVPAGKYGKAALQHLGVWPSVEHKLARAEDVRGALNFVSRDEAPLGIVYRTDAAADQGVKIAGVFPEGSYPPIIYPVAVIAASTKPAALDLLAFLKSAGAKPFFEKQGFSVLP